MNNMLFAIVLLPILCGLFMFIRPFTDRKNRNIYVFIVTCITSILVLYYVISGMDGMITLLRLDDTLSVALRMDGLSRVFAVIVSLRGVMIAGNIFELLKDVIAVGNDVRSFGYGSTPSILVKSLKISGK